MTCHNPKTQITWAVVLGPVVIIFVALGLATDHWVNTDVDRDQLSAVEKTLSNSNQDIARIFHTRHKGILRECYPEDTATFLKIAENVVSSDCFYIDFDDPKGVEISSDYNMRMHLMRGVLGTYVLGLVAVIVAFILGIILCIAKSCHMAHAISMCIFLGALLLLISIVLFHAQEYTEANKDGDPGEIIFQNTWSKTLQKATSSKMGYSYGMAWLAFVLAAVDGVLYLLAARALRLNELSDDDSSVTSSSDDKPVIRKNNEGYDNYGMKPAPFPAAPAAMPTPVYIEPYPPTMMQTMPALPSVPYGNSLYQIGSSDYSKNS